MSRDVWIGCLRIPDVSAWALDVSGGGEDPFLVVEQGRVVGASRTPRRHGVERGMTETQATSLCEEATVRPRDGRLEEVQWEGVLSALNDLTPRIETERPGRAWFEPRDGGPLRRWLDGTDCHCGIAPSRPVALLAAWKAASGRLICIREDHRETFLSRTPVEVLSEIHWSGEPWSEDVVERLRLFGYEHVGGLTSLTERHLEAQFGREGERLYRFLNPDPTRVSFYSPPPAVTATREFDREVSEPGPIREALEDLADTLEERLGRQVCQRLTLCLQGRRDENCEARVLREPTADVGTLYRTATTLLNGLLTAEMEVQGVALEARGLRSASGAQAHLFRERPALRKAVATVQKKHAGALFRVHSQPGAVFEEDRYAFEPMELEE